MPAERSQAPPGIRVRIEDGAAPPRERTFAGSFRVGRASSCEVCLDTPLVSREHLEIRYLAGCWRARDLGSRNGTYLNGERIQEAAIQGEVALRLAENGPILRLRVEGAPRSEAAPSEREPKPAHVDRRSQERDRASATTATRTSAPEATASTAKPRAGEHEAERHPGARGTDHYIEHYLSESEDTDEAGEHTIMIRRAFQSVQKRQRKRWRGVLAGVGGVAVLLIGFAIVQSVRHAAEQTRMQREVEEQREELERARTAATSLFDEVRSLQVQIAQLQMLMEERGQSDLRDQLAKLDESRRRLERRYDGYVEELGLRRSLDPEERLIYHVARVFNESEFGMPADFARQVRESIRSNWQTPAGRGRFERAVRRARERGYTAEVVRTLLQYGLPPQFYYLALQESDFDTQAVGPPTAWGRAKGMWQFIPRTALLYGLDPGPFADNGIVDPRDERHDFAKSTRAAASYLRAIYATLAQASGLLVVASYNWGEHRVVSKLGELEGPQAIPQSAFEGIPESAEARSYWRFLDEFSPRMPEETKDYVLRIFSAAVVGEDPRRFGFEFDSPLAAYLERPDE